ncbi:MAG: VOC family protein [Actinomycetales bacterium]
MTTRADHNLWPGIGYDDAHAARAWLAELGFEQGICVESPGRPGEIQHSEMLWPEGGRVMVHTRGKADDTFATPAGSGNVYVVCEDPDPDAVWAKAEALGAPVLRPMGDTDYGSRGFSVADAEGNSWSFGTYAGE